jgi:hypothetical protein
MRDPASLSRRHFALLPLALAGCGTGTPIRGFGPPGPPGGAADGGGWDPGGGGLVEAGADDASQPQPRPRPTGQPDVRFDNAPHNRVLRQAVYTWTTAEQLAILRQTDVLFQRDERPGMGPGALFSALALAPIRRPELASIVADLRGPKFSKGRYAWINTWGASAGYQGESYGNELITMRLRPEALFLQLWSTGPQSAELGDLVDINNVIDTGPVTGAIRARIAGVYFVNHVGGEYGTFTYGCSNPQVAPVTGYREIFVGNLDMLAQCEAHTQELQDTMAHDASRLTALAPALGTGDYDIGECEWIRRVRDVVWTRQTSPGDALDDYESSLCFLDTPHRPTTANLQALAQTLQNRIPTGAQYVKSY